MNDKIKELALKAANEVADQFASGYFNDEMVYNVADIIAKNYESVVRECIDCVRGAVLADDVALRNKLGFNDGIAEGVVHIQKHFGVDE